MNGEYATIDDVHVIEARGPWTTKSRATLSVRCAFPQVEQSRFFNYREEEEVRLPVGFDIRGLRIYSVRGMPAGNIGGTEYHRIREECVFGLEGKVEWECEDIHGATRTVELTEGNGVWMPPYILHTYRVLEEGSGLLVLANTLFDPEDPRTHDTYSLEQFRALQKRQ